MDAPRIIKQADASGDVISAARPAFEVEPAAPREVRRDAPAESSDEAAPRTRVLHSDRTRPAEPYEVDLDDLQPDFPLPGEASMAGTAAPERLDLLKAEWDAQWQERLDEEVATARAEGREAGYADACAEFDKKQAAHEAVLATDVARLEGLWRDHVEATQPLLVELAFEVAATLIDAPLPDEARRAATQALTEAIDELAGQGPAEIMLHPVDYMRLQEAGITAQLEAAHTGLQWTPDPTLDEGDWSVTAPQAVIRRLRTEMIEMLKHRLHLDDASGD